MIRFQKIGESDGRKIRRKERKNDLQNDLRKNWEERLKNCTLLNQSIIPSSFRHRDLYQLANGIITQALSTFKILPG